MKFAILNDTHCGIRNSSDIFLDNADKFYSELFFPYLIDNNINHIVHLGDIFDNRKFINFRALHRHRKMFLNKLREYKITMDIIPGNHDTYYKNTNDLNSLKELLGHFTDVINIIMEPTVMNYDGLDFALLPWIAPDNEEKSLDFIKNTKALYLGGHLDITGFELMKGTVNAHGMSPDVFNHFDGVYTGHFHTKSSKGNIHYLGSHMEFFWNDAHDPKYFHIFDTDIKQITPVLNPHTLHHRIYYDDTKNNYMEYDLSQVENKFVKLIVVNKNDLFTFDRFVDRIQARKIHELKIADNFNEFIGSSVNDDEVELEDTTTLLNTYVDAVDTDLDKDRIKVQMYELMIEAQTMEVV
jgi:DNA repair exonuclease SbcCD nuclease subunit